MSNAADITPEASVRESLCADCKMDRGCACANNHDECAAFREAVKAERADVGGQPEQKPISPAIPCRCHVELSASWEEGRTEHHADIEFCPKHAAADDMLTALRALQQEFHCIKACTCCDASPFCGRALARQAIAKAEGRE